MEHLLRAVLMNALTASALAVVVAGLSLILSKRPAVVHCLWLITLAKLVSPPLLEAPLGPFALESEAARIQVVAETEQPPLVVDLEPIAETPKISPLESFPAVAARPEEHILTPTGWAFPWRALGLVWLVGVAASASVAVVRIARFQRLLNDAEPARSGVDAEIAKLAARMGLKRRPRAVMVEGRLAPLLWAVGRDPRLVLPRALWEGLNDRQRTLLLAHELAHWKRGDHRVRYFELVVTVLYWWLPVVWWIRRALRDVEEQCCDAWVVWMFPGEARTYAETLLDALDFLNPVADPEPLLASGFGKAAHLRRRLVMVMKGTTPRSLGWTGSLGALALAGILLPIGPIWAQQDDSIKLKDGLDEIVEIHVVSPPTESVQIGVKALEKRKETIEQAMEQLNAQIQAIAAKRDATDAENLQKKALKKLIDQLALIAKSNSKDNVVSIEADSIVLWGPPKGDPKEIEAARAHVEELRQEANNLFQQFTEKQAEVGSAMRKLAELQNKATFTSERLNPQRSLRGREHQSGRADEAAKSRPADTGLGPVKSFPAPMLQLQESKNSWMTTAAKDQDRLDQLEKKLSKVLEELESLKKQKGEAGAKR